MLIPKRKIQVEDFPKQKDFLPQLAAPINLFIADVIRALTKNLTFKENIAGEVLTVIVDGSYPLDINWPNRSLPIAAWIGKCYETSGQHTNFSTSLFLDWEMRSNTTLRINNITGLSATSANPFQVTIVAITG